MIYAIVLLSSPFCPFLPSSLLSKWVFPPASPRLLPVMPISRRRLQICLPTLWNAPTGTGVVSLAGSRHTTTLSSKCAPAGRRSPDPVAVEIDTTNNDTQSNFLGQFTVLILVPQGVIRATGARGGRRSRSRVSTTSFWSRGAKSSIVRVLYSFTSPRVHFTLRQNSSD